MLIRGTISQGRGGLYTAVENGTGTEYVLRAKKKFRRMHIQPLVGDIIDFTPGQADSDEHGWIEEIHPRQNEMTRPPVANITLMLTLIASEPAPDWGLLDRMLIQAQKKSVKSLIVVTKCDLDGGLMYEQAQAVYQTAGFRVLPMAYGSREDLSGIRSVLKGEHACLSGQSGVGKSTLLNQLLNIDTQTGSLSEHIKRGRNTTRHTQLFHVDEIWLFDTPGFFLLVEENAEEPVLLQDYYPEFKPFKDKCRFSPCFHDKEPGCSVKAAVDTTIHRDRYRRYVDILHKDQELWKERFK